MKIRTTLLLVDDEPRVCDSLKCLLHHEGYEILSAHSAREGLEVLGKKNVDVGISDEDMPGMKGTEFLKQVKDRYPQTVRFMLTGKATLAVAMKAINEGAIYRFLQKPVEASDLKITIRQGIQFRDVCMQAYQLARELKEKSRTLEELERQHPGIARVVRGRDGGIQLEESQEGFAEFMKKFSKQTQGSRE